MNLRAALTDNLTLKAASLLLAVGAWFVAQGEQIFHATIEAPVDYLWPESEGELPKLILMNDDRPPDPVRLQVSGSRAAVSRLVQKAREVDVRYEVDLREVAAGRTVHSFLRPPGAVTADVKLETVSPAEVELHFDAVSTVTVPVRLWTRGRLPTGFVETTREVLPSELTLTGSRRELSQLEVVQTMPLRLDDLRRDFEGSVSLDLSSLHLVPDSPRSVQVRFGVEEAMAVREFAGIPIQLSGPFRGYDVHPASAVFQLAGPVPVLEVLAVEGLSVLVEGDPTNLLFPESGGAAIVRYTPSEIVEGAQPGVRVDIKHSRKDEVQLRSMDPLTFELTRPEPEPPEAPTVQDAPDESPTPGAP